MNPKWSIAAVVGVVLLWVVFLLIFLPIAAKQDQERTKVLKEPTLISEVEGVKVYYLYHGPSDRHLHIAVKESNVSITGR
jgi:hypothetical protein